VATPQLPSGRRSLAPLDVLVLLATVAWGVNYAIVKTALRQIPELAFNSLRLAAASLLFLGVLAFWREPVPDRAVPGVPPRPLWRLFPSAQRISTRDWVTIALLAVIGQLVYQLCFMGGIARTSVANSALIQGCSPVVITLIAAAVGQETVSPRHWLGAALSLAGIYLLVGAGASASRTSLVGDALMLAGVCCWASYVVASRPLLDRYSPLAVSGYSMAIGAVMYLPLGIPSLLRLDWAAVPFPAWAALAYSATFSLFLAYLVWYTSIKRVGNVRTAMYSNLIPVVALVTAVVFLGDRLSGRQLAGAGTILVGIGLARFAALRQDAPPAEE
jgi:drug/metabolite transporter (DMT)-like permease